jgi:fission 1 protein
VEARRRLRELLERHPDMHQAQSLKASVDEQVVKDGLVGVGIAAGVVGVGLALLFGSRR